MGPGAPQAVGADLATRVDEALAKGRALLLAAQDKTTGAIGDPSIKVPPNVGFTAIAAAAIAHATPRERVAADADLRKALDWLASQQKENGSVFDNPEYVNYMTSAAVGAFAAAKLPEHAKAMVKARDFLVASQIAGDEADLSYGGFPYKMGSANPVDLSNVQFAAQALADADLPKDHVVWRRIEKYLANVQNRSEVNKIRVEREVAKGVKGTVVSGDDGGAGYAPGISKADYDKRPDGTYQPRSYGSMTYALLKCLLLAGVDPKDTRVIAALGWLSKNFAVDRNPGMPGEQAMEGYYYYLFTAARTLAEYERLTKAPLEVVDAAGRKRDWRGEISEALLARRGEDGGWTNPKDRWQEGSKTLVTAYALQALAFAKRR
jgi:squalene-hopene/tetraprenyl-beta-curcumene cyclase